MHALLWIRGKRRTLEKIEFVGMLRTAKLSNRDYQKQMERWAREGEILLTFED